MTSAQIWMSVSIVAYLIFVVGIGIVCMKKNNDAGDFYLGGRKLGPFVTAMSAEASDMSSYLLMGLPGLAYLSGLSEVGWVLLCCEVRSSSYCACKVKETSLFCFCYPFLFITITVEDYSLVLS